jgi:hypothetical protein
VLDGPAEAALNVGDEFLVGPGRAEPRRLTEFEQIFGRFCQQCGGPLPLLKARSPELERQPARRRDVAGMSGRGRPGVV